MAILVLDLDGTTITSLDVLHKLDSSHVLSNKSYKAAVLFSSLMIKIINPSELADLIEYAYQEHDGVLILTSGMWDSSIRTLLANALNLSAKVKDKLANCPYHSPYEDFAFAKKGSIYDLQRLNKGERLELIQHNNPELSKQNFVIIDDMRLHVESFDQCHNVKAILATTSKPNKAFYQEARAALAHFKQNKQAVEPVTKSAQPLKRRRSIFAEDIAEQNKSCRVTRSATRRLAKSS